MASRPLTGQRLAPLQGPATSLVVLVHGYGADGNDLISLAGHWQGLLPTTEFVAPNAPERLPGGQGGYQWFALTRRDPHEMEQGVRSAAPVLEEFVKAEEARLGLTREAVALVGFSQGTMLSLEVGLHRPVAAIVGFSGLLAAPPPATGGGAADLSGPWQRRSGHSGGRCLPLLRPWGRRAPRCNGIWPKAWATASIRPASIWRANSWPWPLPAGWPGPARPAVRWAKAS